MERQAHARLSLRRQRQRFFSNPVNLLLPFTLGALLAARLRARPAHGNRRARGTSLRQMLHTGLNLWAATESLRQSMATSAEPAADIGANTPRNDTVRDSAAHEA